jgi:phosphoglycerol transferase MdoB-like AlkP superfamily enzyme
LGAEYMGTRNSWKGHTPFLDELAKDSLTFELSFANGRRSIEAVWSIVAGIPSLMDEPYVTSAYKDNRLVTIPKVLAQHGYASSFFHAGKNGTMFFDYFSKMAGFEQYIGMNEYDPDRRTIDFDGTWGIFDGPFLQFFRRKLSEKSQPFFSTLFTLSSHNPYKLPSTLSPELAARFRKTSTHPVHEVISYADYSLQQFFENARKEPWFEKTLFILTGDHTSTGLEPSYQNDLGFFRVPIFLYSPSVKFNQNFEKKIANHVDIPCTIYDFLDLQNSIGPPPEATPFCHSLLSDSSPGRSLLRSGENVILVTKKYWARKSPNSAPKIFPIEFLGGWGIDTPYLPSPEILDAVSKKIHAGQQIFNNGMNENSLYSPEGWR